jgi:hypothetical protein
MQKCRIRRWLSALSSLIYLPLCVRNFRLTHPDTGILSVSIGRQAIETGRRMTPRLGRIGGQPNVTCFDNDYRCCPCCPPLPTQKFGGVANCDWIDFCLRRSRTRRFDMKSAVEAPSRIQPPNRFRGGLLWPVDLFRNPLATIPCELYSNTYLLGHRFGRTALWITDARLIRTVLQEEARSFEKSPLEKRILRPAHGAGIMISEGKTSHWQR